jgi:hypothetical protein
MYVQLHSCVILDYGLEKGYYFNETASLTSDRSTDSSIYLFALQPQSRVKESYSDRPSVNLDYYVPDRYTVWSNPSDLLQNATSA